MTTKVILDDKKSLVIAEEFTELVGPYKTKLAFSSMVILGVLAGAYIAFGGLLATVATFDLGILATFSIKKVLFGSTFTLGLILVVIAGAELFTGNNLIILSVLSKKTSWVKLIENWIVIYFANFIGSIIVALIFYFSGLWKTGDNSLGITAINIACAKVNLNFNEAFFRAVGCNWMVCLAVWMAWGSRTIHGKILAIFFPIMGFVAIGFEHCVANMYFIPTGLFLKQWTEIIPLGADFNSLTWNSFFIKNLIPVTLGNIFGGTFFVGMTYWYAYVKPSKNKKQ